MAQLHFKDRGMTGFFDRHRNISLLAALCIFSFSIFALSARQKNHLTPLEQGALAALAPFQKVLNWGADKVFDAWDGYILLFKVRQENELLRQRLKQMTMENHMLSEKLLEYGRMEQLFNAAHHQMAGLTLARVIGRDSSGFARLITIDKGASDGIKEKMPVLTHQGLVGRIIRVSRNAAKVMLITDVRSAVDALSQDSRDGMVAAGANSQMLTVRYLKVDSGAKEGEKVVSSGLGGIYPKGLVIGLLAGITREKEDLFVTARITPLASLDRLEEVLVMKEFLPLNLERENQE